MPDSTKQTISAEGTKMNDIELSQTLGRIEQYSSWLVSDAETVKRNVRALKYQPGFETKAAATLQLAKERLESAMREVDHALAGFAEKPVEASKAVAEEYA